MRRLVYRAGWPEREHFQRFGAGWVRVGPYVLGNVAAWDRSSAS